MNRQCSSCEHWSDAGDLYERPAGVCGLFDGSNVNKGTEMWTDLGPITTRDTFCCSLWVARKESDEKESMIRPD